MCPVCAQLRTVGLLRVATGGAMSRPEARWAKTGFPNKFPHAFYILLCFFWFSGVFSGQAQTNSYISSGDGFWDEARLWSLAAAPSVSQSGISITNAVSKTVTI